MSISIFLITLLFLDFKKELTLNIEFFLTKYYLKSQMVSKRNFNRLSLDWSKTKYLDSILIVNLLKIIN